MEPGEKVVSAVSHRDFILVFGAYGTVLKMFMDFDGHPTFRVCAKLQEREY